jgi:L-asparagine oxygenase
MTGGFRAALRPESVLDHPLVLREPVISQLGPDSPLSSCLQAGGRVVLLDVGMCAIEALRWAGVTGALLPPVAGDNPLVRAETMDAAGCGLFAGLQLALTELIELNGEALVRVDGRTVVAEFAVGAGRLVVLPGQWTGRLEIGDNALALVRATTGIVGSVLEDDERARRSHPGSRLPHPDIESVCAEDWDLGLLGEGGTDINASPFMRAAGRSGRLLPAGVHDALVDFADHGNDAGALLIRGVPVGDLPLTPSLPVSAEKLNKASEFALLTVARRLGQPVGYAPEHGGALVQNIAPVARDADRQVSTSSKSTLAFHTEAAFHPHRPRYLLLLCLRGDPAAATTLCSVRALTAALSPRDRAVLAAARFTTAADESYVGGPSSKRSLPRAILTGDLARPKLWLDADLMRGTDDEAQGALERLSALTSELATGVVLEAGDLLVVDNDVAVHGRSPFKPRFDGTDRWLQRTFVVADHTAADGEREGRIIGTRFLA